MFPPAPRYYTQYNGKRCALPLLADDYGLYYNKTMFKAAGITSPPKTISELTADAKKLTVRNADGSIKVAGLDPIIGFYENVARAVGHLVRREVARRRRATRSSRKRSGLGEVGEVAEEPGRLVRLQEAVRFQAGLGDEFSASQAFEAGKLAMNLDGEWRVAFIQNEHPEAQLRDGADARRRRSSRAVRLRLHQRHDHRHPARTGKHATRRGRSSST